MAIPLQQCEICGGHFVTWNEEHYKASLTDFITVSFDSGNVYVGVCSQCSARKAKEQDNA